MNRKNSELNANVVTNSQNVVLEIPYIYYKGYTIKIDNNKSNYDISDNGFIKINIADIGQHKIYVKYTGTIIYNISDLIAIIVLVICIINILKGKSLRNKCIESKMEYTV